MMLVSHLSLVHSVTQSESIKSLHCISKFKKMKVKVLFIGLFASVLLLNSEAFISIRLDPEDLERVGDFFQSIMINEQAHTHWIHTPTHRIILSWAKKTAVGVFHLIGVMLALVGANLLSLNLTPDAQMQVKQQSIEPEKKIQASNDLSNVVPKYTDICDVDFGCHRSLCWKTCHIIVNEKKQWCFTSPDPHVRQFQHCNKTNDCSVCWDCIESCHG